LEGHLPSQLLPTELEFKLSFPHTEQRTNKQEEK